VSATLDAAAIEAVIPHRPPFRFIDEIRSLEPGVRAVGLWRVPHDAWFLRGHFPGNAIVPGVLLAEAAAQTAAVCALTDPEHHGKFGVFAAIDNTRFSRIVRPGEDIRIDVSVARLRGRLGRVDATATVNEQVAMRASLSFALLSEPPA
jgi:3-hydroxyacyl-[acyl-carrier-protein] dehydratase